MIFKTITLLLAAASMAFAANIQLSPSGPVSTPQAARDAARSATKPARIVVSEGVYALTEALALSVENSQVTCEAAPNAPPVFSADKAVTGGSNADGGLWKVALSDKAWAFGQLWINGGRATRARTPNKDYFNITDAVGAGVFSDLTKDVNFRAFAVAPEHYVILKAIPQDQRDGVLECPGRHPRRLSLSEIAAEMGLNINFVYRVTQALTAHGYVNRDADKRFYVGAKLLELCQPQQELGSIPVQSIVSFYRVLR